VGGKLHGLEVEVQGADDGVVESLVAGPVKPDVVGGPPNAEVLATGGKLADQLDELLVAGVAACLGAEHGGDVVGGAFPVGEEVVSSRIEVDEAGVVDWPAGVGEERGLQGAGHAVGGEHVVPGVADPGGRVGNGVQDLLDAAGDAGSLGPSLPGRAGLSRPGQVKQVGTFGLVELKRVRDAVQDSVGRAGQVSSLHADVIVNADAREQADLLAPEPLHPAVTAVGG